MLLLLMVAYDIHAVDRKPVVRRSEILRFYGSHKTTQPVVLVVAAPKNVESESGVLRRRVVCATESFQLIHSLFSCEQH